MNNFEDITNFDLGLDTVNFNSENIRSIDEWEQELDICVLNSRALLSTSSERDQFDVMVADLLFELQQDNDVLDNELRDLIDSIYESVTMLKLNNLLLDIDTLNSEELFARLDEFFSEFPDKMRYVLSVVFANTSRSSKLILYARNLKFPNFKQAFENLLQTDPEFVRGHLGFRQFFELAVFDSESFSADSCNKILKVVFRSFVDVIDLCFSSDGPLHPLEISTHEYGNAFRRALMSMFARLTEHGELSAENQASYNDLLVQQQRLLSEFISDPESFVAQFNIRSFLQFTNLVLDNMDAGSRNEFKLKVLQAFDEPNLIIGVDSIMSGLTQQEFDTTNSENESRKSILQYIKLGIDNNCLSSKMYNLLFIHLGDRQFLRRSFESFEGGVLTQFDGLSYREDESSLNWLESESNFARSGFFHSQALSLLGECLRQNVSGDNELVLTYPGSGDHVGLVETVARVFENTNIERALIKFTEVTDKRSNIVSVLRLLAQNSSVISDVTDFEVDSTNANLSILNLKIYNRPVRIEFYLNAFHSEQDDWAGLENIRQSDLIMLHDLDASSFYSESDYKFIQQFINGSVENRLVNRARLLEVVSQTLASVNTTLVREFLTENSSEWSSETSNSFTKLIRFSSGSLSHVQARLAHLTRYVASSQESKMVVMSMEDFRKFQSQDQEYGFSVVDYEIIEADPGAIFGCSCNNLAHEGMVVLRLKPRGQE